MIDASLRTCSKCGNQKPLQHFLRKGKHWKTCNLHAEARSMVSDNKRKIDETHGAALKRGRLEGSSKIYPSEEDQVAFVGSQFWDESNDQGILGSESGSQREDPGASPRFTRAFGFMKTPRAFPTYSRLELRKAGACSHLVDLPVLRCPLCRDFASDAMGELREHLEIHATRLGQTDQCSWIEAQLQLQCAGKENGLPRLSTPDRRPGIVQFESYRMHAYSQYVRDVIVKEAGSEVDDDCWSAVPDAKKHYCSSVKSLLSEPHYLKPGSLPATQPMDAVPAPFVDTLDLLFVAIARHDDNWVRSLVPHCPRLDQESRPLRDSSGRIGTMTTRALTHAVVAGSDTSVDILLQYSTSIVSYHADDCCGTALWAAVIWSQYDMARKLCQKLAAGTRPVEVASDLVDKHRHSLPGLSGRTRLTMRIIDSGLALAVHQADWLMARILLVHGANPNTLVSASLKAVASLEIPALCYAAYTNDNEMGAILVANGADVNAQCKIGTVLSFLAGHGNAKAMRVVLDRGADPNTFPDFCWPPLASAVKSGSMECAQLLLHAGAMVNLQGRARISSPRLVKEITGPSPLMAAIRYGNIEIADLLIHSGADINVQGGVFGSALGEAVHRSGEREQLIDFCLQTGANIRATCINCHGLCQGVASYLQTGTSSMPHHAIPPRESIESKLVKCVEQTSKFRGKSPWETIQAFLNTNASRTVFENSSRCLITTSQRVECM